MPDIDLDFADRSLILDRIQHIPASIRENDSIKRHNTGVYCQVIPYDVQRELAAIDYKEAEDRGYFKIDFLNVNVYKDVRDSEHLDQLMNTEPLWDLLHQKDFCDMIFHVNGYHNMLAQLNPTTVEELAMFLALIRPAKRHLTQSVKDHGWSSITGEIWQRPANGEYYFKKSHAVAYAHAVIVNMNLICEKISYGYS